MSIRFQNHYKAGVHLELQRFQNFEKKRVIRLAAAELRALTALTILLTDTGYKGRVRYQDISYQPWDQLKKAPAVRFRLDEYYKAYYGLKSDDPVPKGHQVDIANQALSSLCRKDDLTVSFTENNIVKTEYDTNLVKMQNKSMNKRGERTVIYHPIFIYKLKKFNLLKPIDLYSKIRASLGKNRFSKSIPLFIEWLLTKNEAIYKIGVDKLISRLWLDNYMQDRHKDRVYYILYECFETAKSLGYLLDDAKQVNEDGNELFVFDLNPELCSRLTAKSYKEKS
jgi:hypothetical protein